MDNTEVNIFLEIFGYIGTILVITSMMMTSVMKLRIINICGSIISAIYSVFCNAWPIVIMNACLIIINIIQIIRQLRHKYEFGHLVVDANDKSMHYFLSVYANDIAKFFPNYKLQARPTTEIHMVYIGSEAVGILVGTRIEDVFNIEMDYAVPKYRDIAVEKFLFPTLKKDGISMLTSVVTTKEHNNYLNKMGFVDDCGILIKNI